MNTTAPSITLSITIVVYHPDKALLARTAETLEAALAQLDDVAGRACLHLMDNGGPSELAVLPASFDAEFDTVVLKGRGNGGYGRVTTSRSSARRAGDSI